MADQKRIKLYPLHATPKNIIVRELPVASVSSTKIYLYPGHATAKNIIIGDPTVIRAGGSPGAITATASQNIAAVTQSVSADLLIQSTASQTIAAVTQSVTADVLVQSTAAQTISAVTQTVNADLLVQATASQTIDAVTQSSSADLLIQATAAQTISAITQAAMATIVSSFPTQYFGLRYYDGSVFNLCLVATADAPAGDQIRINKNGTTYAVYIVDTNDPNASNVRVNTSAGIKALRLKT